MKKILVVLLILAVAAGAFAQGEWTLEASASAEMTIDGSTAAKGSPNHSTVVGSDFSGDLDLSYTRGGIEGTIGFSRGGAIGLGVSGTGDNFAFKATGDLGLGGGFSIQDQVEYSAKVTEFDTFMTAINTAIGVGTGDPLFDAFSEWLGDDAVTTDNTTANVLAFLGSAEYAAYVGTGKPLVIPTGRATNALITAGDLWGWYKFLDGMIQLQVSVAGGDLEDMWRSYEASVDHWYWAWMGADPVPAFAAAKGTASAVGNRITANATLGDLQAGVIIPNLFNAKSDFMKLSLEKMTFGASYAMDGIMDAAINFSMNGGVGDKDTYSNSIYIGANLSMLDPLSVGVAFAGTLPTSTEDGKTTRIDFAAGVGFSAGDFSASVDFIFGNYSVKGAKDYTNSQVAILPSISYKIIPESLLAALDVQILMDTQERQNVDKEVKTFISFAPALYWNFLGDGATDDLGTGIYFKYKLGFASSDDKDQNKIWEKDNPLYNEAVIGFKWSL